MRTLRPVVFGLLAALAAALTPAPDGASAQDSYRIRPGDVLRIEVLEDPSLNRETLVLPDGRVSVPLAGSVRVAGRSVEQVQAALTSALASNFAARPNVFVGLSRLVEPEERAEIEAPTLDVYIVGEASRPGKITVEPGTTLLQLFAQMGGFNSFAATKRVQLRRTDPATGREVVYRLNYDAIERGTSPNGTVAVADGDVIVVPQRGLFE